MSRWLPLALVALTTSMAQAGPTPAPIRAEIDGLIAELGHQACRFQRNGRWHTLSAAQQLLQHKLEQIESRSTLSSTEQFIELAATRSSTSGQIYQIQCGKELVSPSADWLRAALTHLRKR